MADTIATSTLTPKANTDGKTVPVRQFKITDIPDAMRKMNWPVAAALMDHWFEGKPWDNETQGMPIDVKIGHLDVPSQYVEKTIIKMDWALQYQPVNEKIKVLLAEWDSPPGRRLMLKRFNQHYADMASGTVELDFGGQADQAERFGYFNSRPYNYSKLSFEVDELRAALADFTLKVIAEGSVKITQEEYILYPVRLGFYIDDTYDFIDDSSRVSQVLGYWNFDGLATVSDVASNEIATGFKTQSLVRRSLFMHGDEFEKQYADISAQRYFLARNKSFQEYRTKSGMGGDFRVFSDMYFLEIAVPPIILRRAHDQ
jgi:hypothetical protein